MSVFFQSFKVCNALPKVIKRLNAPTSQLEKGKPHKMDASFANLVVVLIS
jgi:hypothetical protein